MGPADCDRRGSARDIRVADGLDRTHKGYVERIETSVDDRSIHFRVSSPTGISPTYELWSANRKKGLMEETFQRDVTITSLQEEAVESVAA